MATVVPAEGVILKRVLEAAPGISPEGLSREAYAKFHAALMKTEWGRDHRRRFALVDGADMLRAPRTMTFPASSIAAGARVWNRRDLHSAPDTHGLARELEDQLLNKASRDGAAIALLFSDMRPNTGQPASKWFQ